MLAAIFWFLGGAATLLGIASLWAGWQHWQAVVEGMREQAAEWMPPATLIVPVKGREEGLVENVRSLVEQNYEDLEVLVAVRQPDDPAVEAIQPLLGLRGRLVVAGEGPPGTGEKVGNLLAAVAAARAASEILAFADSDGRVERGWLRALVAPLRESAVGAVTGYRWYFPERGGFWPLVRSAWNATIAGTFGAGRPAFAWGGAMALRRETFEKARVEEFWAGSASDDYRLTEALRAARLEIRFAPRAMVASEGCCSAREFLAWAVRQMIITRVYNPRLWWTGFAAHAIYCGAMAAGILALAGGELWAAPLLVAAVTPGMWRGVLRRRAAQAMFPHRADWLERHGWVYSWLAPLVTWVWLYVFLASAWRRRIEWRGVAYELVSPSETRLVK